MIPLSKIGISKGDRELLAKRLFPEVNKIFLQNLAKQNNVKYENLQELDYSDHPQFKMERMMRQREIQKHYLKNKDTSEFDYPYKTIEEARANGVNVVTPDKVETVEELNARIEKLRMKKMPLDDLSSDDEKEEEKIWETVKEATINSC